MNVQKSPCVFQIVAAGQLEKSFKFDNSFNAFPASPISLPGRPFPLQNCTLSTDTELPDSVHVECLESFDGGLPQGFLLELVEVPSLRLVRNLSLLVSFPFIDLLLCSYTIYRSFLSIHRYSFT